MATLISRLDPFSDTCGTVVDMPNVNNYLLFYQGEFHSLVKGVDENLYSGEELVEIGVKGIHCD